MLKWIAGIIGAVLSGVILWTATTYLEKRVNPPSPTPPPDDRVHASCAASPGIIRPGALSQITVVVTRGGQPVENANVKIEAGGGSFPDSTLPSQSGGLTPSDGTVRVLWKAPMAAHLGFEIGVHARLDNDGSEAAASCDVQVSSAAP